MWKLFKKEARDKLKKHPDHHDCNFGISKFNETKRTKGFIEELNLKKGKPPHGGPPPGPPPLPPTSNNAPGVLYLDFKGGVISGTNWNVSGDINYAWSGLTNQEIAEIVVYVQIAFMDINVIVTADRAIYDSCDPYRRMQCIYTETWEWYGKAGGTSFVGSFSWGSGNPCWVFTSLLGYVVRKIESAGRHELGHTLGCYHQSVWENGVKTNEYNPGDGVNSPIMGYPYDLPDKWWNGINSRGAAQDDFAIIKSKAQ